MSTEMKSFRLNEQAINNLCFLSDVFGYSQSQIISLILYYAVKDLKKHVWEKDPDSIINFLAFSKWGFGYEEKLIKMFPKN